MTCLHLSFIALAPKAGYPRLFNLERPMSQIYNLAFGNLRSDGSLDDHVKNDNKDRNRILATVASAIYNFTANYPERFVLFKGSTDGRTRLYRMALTINFQEISIDFEIYGVHLHGDGYLIEPFDKTKDYAGFVIKRKIN